MLLNQEEGLNILRERHNDFFVQHSSFMDEIIEMLNEEITFQKTGKSSLNRIFTPESVRTTMARELFTWIGLFTNCKGGRKLLRSAGLDSMLMKIADIEHLSPLLLVHLDYKDQISRDFLCFALQSRSTHIKKHAMEFLRVLYRTGIFDLSWGVKELVT